MLDISLKTNYISHVETVDKRQLTKFWNQSCWCCREQLGLTLSQN